MGEVAVSSLDDAHWAAVASRDAGADGSFVFSVSTTGIYCRPSCPARRPLRGHVGYHRDAAAARAAGFRACKRCRPDEPAGRKDADAVASACRLIDAAETPPSIAELAAAAGLSRFHFARVFRRVTGSTPHDYAAQRRADRVRALLGEGEPVTGALFEAGFGASSRFYAAAPAMLGMAPARYRESGKGERIRHAIVPTTLGFLLVAAAARGVCLVALGDGEDELARMIRARFARATHEAADAIFTAWVEAVVGAIEEPRGALDLPLDIRGTAFQQRVWAALREVPAGETRSYAQIAQAIGAPGAVRAVANACGANALAVVIPCHRIVRSDGGSGGYRWGAERKAALLAREEKLTARHAANLTPIDSL